MWVCPKGGRDGYVERGDGVGGYVQSMSAPTM